MTILSKKSSTLTNLLLKMYELKCHRINLFIIGVGYACASCQHGQSRESSERESGKSRKSEEFERKESEKGESCVGKSPVCWGHQGRDAVSVFCHCGVREVLLGAFRSGLSSHQRFQHWGGGS